MLQSSAYRTKRCLRRSSSRSSSSSTMFDRSGEITPRTQKVTCLLGGSRRGRVRRLRIIGIRTDQWDWERVADGKTVCIDKNFFDQQSQDLLAFVNVYSFCPCTELPSKSIQALCKLHISNLVHCCRLE